jgi:hypothetical protein
LHLPDVRTDMELMVYPFSGGEPADNMVIKHQERLYTAFDVIMQSLYQVRQGMQDGSAEYAQLQLERPAVNYGFTTGKLLDQAISNLYRPYIDGDITVGLNETVHFCEPVQYYVADSSKIPVNLHKHRYKGVMILSLDVNSNHPLFFDSSEDAISVQAAIEIAKSAIALQLKYLGNRSEKHVMLSQTQSAKVNITRFLDPPKIYPIRYAETDQWKIRLTSNGNTGSEKTKIITDERIETEIGKIINRKTIPEITQQLDHLLELGFERVYPHIVYWIGNNYFKIYRDTVFTGIMFSLPSNAIIVYRPGCEGQQNKVGNWDIEAGRAREYLNGQQNGQYRMSQAEVNKAQSMVLNDIVFQWLRKQVKKRQ